MRPAHRELRTPRTDLIDRRGKTNLMLLMASMIPLAPCGGPEISKHYLTKFEVGASLGYGVRAGFNPGELLDFILGFLCVDIYGDDVDDSGSAEIDKDSDKDRQSSDLKSVP